MASGWIEFYDQRDFRGEKYEEKAPTDVFEVPFVPAGKSTVASIWVNKGTWLVYTENNFSGASYLLQPTDDGYVNPEMIQKKAPALSTEQWTGQVRSVRLVTPRSMMIFDDDFFRGACYVYKDTTNSIEANDSRSMIIESGSTAIKHQELDMAFVLDGSGSIGAPNFEKVKQFAVKMSAGLQISPTATRVSLIQYSSGVTVEFKLADHTDEASVKMAINNIKYQSGGSTMTGKALKTARTLSWREAPAKRVVIVVTDGQANDDVKQPAKALRDNNISVYAVGVGYSVNVAELNQIVGGDAGKVFQIADYDKLEKEIAKISESVTKAPEWLIYKLGQFHGNQWKAFPGYYNREDLMKNIGDKIGSAKRL